MRGDETEVGRICSGAIREDAGEVSIWGTEDANPDRRWRC